MLTVSQNRKSTSVTFANDPAKKNGSVAVFHGRKRVEINKFVKRFQKILGPQWDAYQMAVSLFIVGKLSREELMEEIATVVNRKETRHMHNQLLMTMLANCYKNEPLDGVNSGFFGHSAKKRQLGGTSSQYERLKKDILSLSVRERIRLKSITRDSGKKNINMNTMIATRQAMVPKVPVVTNNSVNSANSSTTETKSIGTDVNGSPKQMNSVEDGADVKQLDSSQTQKSGNNLEMTLIAVKDILDMIDEPLCTESFELPERRRLRNIMLGLAREHGLLGGVSMKAVDVLYHGIAYYLKTLFTYLIDFVRARNENTDAIEQNSGTKKKRVTITSEDVHDLFSIIPHLIQPYGTIDYLLDCKLKNDDDYEIISAEVEDLIKGKDTDLPENIESISDSNLWNEIERVISDGSYNGYSSYVIPNKITDVSSLLRSHEEIQKEKVEQQQIQASESISVPKLNLAFKDKELGTPDELCWVINDLLAEEM
ncbi:hypothetical protein CANINC_000600 [Pichia inconspicua]|uniref:Transcriptional coactivator HFI1/ADA1 n=1 Tax=Pichia inconspicua TaxID=52247 RepID=A0A4T0X740_9ASCO|nr:hypothetical protein CANINC_000600 [[Candida] inconspicua]